MQMANKYMKRWLNSTNYQGMQIKTPRVRMDIIKKRQEITNVGENVQKQNLGNVYWCSLYRKVTVH